MKIYKTKTRKKKKAKIKPVKIVRADRDERDGITECYRSWAGKAVNAMQPFGTDTGFKWFTCNAVIKRVMELEGHGIGEMPDNMAQVLYSLVKSGHLERALMPDKLKAKYQVHRAYIYRLTGKRFRSKVLGQGMHHAYAADIQTGYKLRLKHKQLPKWFRDMMQ